jgi:putative transposase
MHSPEAVHASIEYLHNNPVRRKLVATPTEWEWSSARWYAGRRDVPLAMDDGIFE